MASKNRIRVSLEEKRKIRRGRILRNLDVDLRGAYVRVVGRERAVSSSPAKADHVIQRTRSGPLNHTQDLSQSGERALYSGDAIQVDLQTTRSTALSTRSSLSKRSSHK
jgi:hypothetical protein